MVAIEVVLVAVGSEFDAVFVVLGVSSLLTLEFVVVLAAVVSTLTLEWVAVEIVVSTQAEKKTASTYLFDKTEEI